MLYRHFDADDRLLYVGISSDAARRAAEHGLKPWGPLIHRITVQHYATRKKAEEAERQAIKTEVPIYNIRHSPRLHPAPPTKPRAPPQQQEVDLDLESYLFELERSILIRALQIHRGNATAAARRLGISYRQMRYRMKLTKIDRDELVYL